MNSTSHNRMASWAATTEFVEFGLCHRPAMRLTNVAWAGKDVFRKPFSCRKASQLAWYLPLRTVFDHWRYHRGLESASRLLEGNCSGQPSRRN
jgi:hypothetical protein